MTTQPRMERLSQAGVSIWCDSIARDWLQKGELRRLIDQFGIVGVTSNPTIFQKAMGEGSFYDDDLGDLAGQGLDGPAIFERLALGDVAAAADELAAVYERTDAGDGYVSFEVAPDLAGDTEATTKAAARLFAELDRPNVFIKIPATPEGVPAIRRSIAAGINVNVTLIFSIERYREVMEAYLSGLEERLAAGGEIDRIASVASFFVSRVDTNVDPKLQALIDRDDPNADKARARLGTAAIDNAKLAYKAFGEVFSGPRWAALAAKGARVQRPLWASTSTKNPDYRDVLYVEELVAPDTVNTMPLETIEAFADHGEVRGATGQAGMDRAERLWPDLAELGIDEDQVGLELEHEGVAKFADSYADAVRSVERKRQAVAK